MNILLPTMPAPEITMSDRNGDLRSLYDVKSTITILDFWGSWCVPCRKENKHLVSIYNNFKDKGLDIFSVSIDDNKDSWIRAIENDKLIWDNHVGDMKKWESPIVPIYLLKNIPTIYILDIDKKIIAKNIKGHKLEEKINELIIN